MIEANADVWGTVEAAFEIRPRGTTPADPTEVLSYTSFVNGADWLDLTRGYQIRCVLTGAGGTNVIPRMSY